jgi:uncharacterized membrane protein
MKSIAILVASLAVVTAFVPQQNVVSSSTKLEALADQVRKTRMSFLNSKKKQRRSTILQTKLARLSHSCLRIFSIFLLCLITLSIFTFVDLWYGFVFTKP